MQMRIQDNKASGRNLVVCCDGTSNEIGLHLSNVLKLYRVAVKDERQLTFYHPGIGTIAVPNSWGRLRQWLRSKFEMATGRGLDRDVLAAYVFLCQNYRPGDRIFLFGFSRGAYTVRVVAGMLYLIGLMRPHQANLAGYALKAYKGARLKDDFALAKSFERTMNPLRVAVHFMGVWDTVSSVIVPGRIPIWFGLEELPYTTQNPAVRAVRHATAIDEFRRMFRLKAWDVSQVFKPNPYSKAETHNPQDFRQVWFAGSHADVGGGYLETESALSKFPLIWMIEQAKNDGLLVRTQMVNHTARGHERDGWRKYAKPEADGQLHRSLRWGWWILEILPKFARRPEWPKRWSIPGLYFPLGEPRPMPEGCLIHTSVYERLRQRPTEEADDREPYRPANIPVRYFIETMTGPLTKKTRRRRQRTAPRR